MTILARGSATIPDKVVDASVVAAVVFWEPERDRALELLDGAGLHASSVLDYELASVARTKIRRFPEREQAFLANLADGLATDIVRWPVDYVALVQLALQAGISTYDASYLWLARHLSIPLVTFDRRLALVAGSM